MFHDRVGRERTLGTLVIKRELAMASTKTTGSAVQIKCFCGNSMSVNPRARKGVTCDKCHQPLPMKAIKMAVEFRTRDSARANPLKRAPAATV